MVELLGQRILHEDHLFKVRYVHAMPWTVPPYRQVLGVSLQELNELLDAAELLAKDVKEMTIFDPIIPYERAQRLLELIERLRNVPR